MERTLDNFTAIGSVVKGALVLAFLLTIVPLYLFLIRKALNKKVS